MSTLSRGPHIRRPRKHGLARNLKLDGRNVRTIPTRRLDRHIDARKGVGAREGVRPKAVVAPAVDPAVLADPLPAPAPADNLVKESAASSTDPINIQWGGFNDAFPTDIISFELDGVEFDTITVTGTETPPFIGKLPAALRTEGKHILTVYYTGNTGGQRSPEVPIAFDYTRPSDGRLLSPLLFDPKDDIPVPGTGITAAKYRTDGQGKRYIWVQVAGYYGLAPGDRVHLFCNDIEEIDIAVAVDATSPIEVHISEDFLKTVADGPNAKFTYVIQDRCGLSSEVSAPIYVDIHLGEIAGLVAPTVPSYDDDDATDPDNPPLIDDADARGTANGGFIVVVPWNDDYAAGDKILLSLGSENAGPVDLGADGDDMEILFPFSGSHAVWLAGSTNGTVDKRVAADVTYTVVRGPSTAGTSPPHPVELNLYQQAVDPDPETPVNERLQPAVFVSSSGKEDAVPVADFGQDSTIEIEKLSDAGSNPIGAAFSVGDTLRIYYGTQPAYTFAVTDLSPPNEPLSVPFVGTLMELDGSGNIPLWYEIVHALTDGGTNVNLSPTKVVAVQGTDTQPGKGHLDAGNFTDKTSSGHIPQDQHLTETRFEIPDYENRSADDQIALHFEMFYGPVHLANETKYAGFDWDHTVESGDAKPIVVMVPASVYNLNGKVTAPASPYLHIHAYYTVTKKSGDLTPVTSDEANVAVDCRFSPPIP